VQQPGQNLTFENFEERATTGRDVANVLLEPELADRSKRVDPACDRESLPGPFGAASECVLFEHSDRTVANDRTRLTKLTLIGSGGARSNIKNDIVVIGDCIGRPDSR
jgi:hypothetical protein